MNYIKRALTSITRQITKSIILFLIVTILGTVMLSTLLVTQSVEANKKSVLNAMPPIVELQENYEFYQNQDPDFDWEKELDAKVPLTPEVVQKIVDTTSDLLKTYDYSSFGSIKAHKTFKRYSLQDNNMISYGGNPDDEYSMYMMLTGVQNPEFKDLAIGKAKLLNGRLFTDQEIKDGSNVAIISKELAEANGFTVGSMIKTRVSVEDWDQEKAMSSMNYIPEVIYSEDIEIEVIGIIEYNDRPSEKEIKNPSQNVWSYEEKVNSVYVTNSFNEKTQKIQFEHMNSGESGVSEYTTYISNVTFVLKDPKDAAKFVEIAKTVFNEKWNKYVTQEEQYNKVSKPLDDIQSTMNMVFYLTVGASILVLSLVLIGFAKDRKKEIGIYLALGEKKGRIAGQLTIESVIVTFVAATLAIGLGLLLATMISSGSIPKELVTESPQNGMWIGMETNTIEYSEIINSFKIGLSVMSIVLFYIAIIGSALIAQIISSFYTLRLDPKKIMM